MYRDEYAEQARKLCLLGATDAELADFFNVTETTVNNWKNDYPEFFDSIACAKRLADAQIADALHQRAMGYRWVEQQAFKVKTGQHTETVEIVEVERVVPPDTPAASLWLRNRQPTKWRDKQDIEHTGPGGGPIVNRIERVIVDAKPSDTGDAKNSE